MAGTILASMCKSCVAVQPEMALEFFVPHFCQKISSIISERRAHPHQKSHQKIDQELQFALLLLSEVISIRGLQFITRYVFRLLFLGNCSPRTQVMLLHPFIHPSNLALFSHTKAACQIYETSLVCVVLKINNLDQIATERILPTLKRSKSESWHNNFFYVF